MTIISSKAFPRVKDYFKELLSIFSEENVDFMIVGAYAVMYYTEPRFTKDHDVWVRPSPENAARVIRALKRFGAPLHDVTETDFAVPGIMFQIGVTQERIDILTELSGLEFEEAWPGKVFLDTEKLRIPIIGKRELIKNKIASGRPNDLNDVARLQSD
jgi:hypothetical protein